MAKTSVTETTMAKINDLAPRIVAALDDLVAMHGRTLLDRRLRDEFMSAISDYQKRSSK